MKQKLPSRMPVEPRREVRCMLCRSSMLDFESVRTVRFSSTGHFSRARVKPVSSGLIDVSDPNTATLPAGTLSPKLPPLSHHA